MAVTQEKIIEYGDVSIAADLFQVAWQRCVGRETFLYESTGLELKQWRNGPGVVEFLIVCFDRDSQERRQAVSVRLIALRGGRQRLLLTMFSDEDDFRPVVREEKMIELFDAAHDAMERMSPAETNGAGDGPVLLQVEDSRIAQIKEMFSDEKNPSDIEIGRKLFVGESRAKQLRLKAGIKRRVRNR